MSMGNTNRMGPVDLLWHSHGHAVYLGFKAGIPGQSVDSELRGSKRRLCYKLYKKGTKRQRHIGAEFF